MVGGAWSRSAAARSFSGGLQVGGAWSRSAAVAARSGSGGLLGGADVAQTSSRRGAAGSEPPLRAVGATALPVGLSWSALKSRWASGFRACCRRRRCGSGVVDVECGRWRFVPVCSCVGAVVGGCLRRRLLRLKVGARHGRGGVMVGACSVSAWSRLSTVFHELFSEHRSVGLRPGRGGWI